MTVAAAAAAIVEDDLGATTLGCGCLNKLRTMNKYRTIDFVGKVSRIGNNSSRKDGRVLRSIGENNVAVVALSKDNKRYSICSSILLWPLLWWRWVVAFHIRIAIDYCC